MNEDWDDRSSVVDVNKIRLPLLTSTNYFLWSRKIELVLRSKGLWSIVDGCESPPEGSGESLRKFDRRKEIALSTILLLVHDSCVAPVMDMRNPSLVWKTLKEQHQAVSQASRDGLLDRYQAMKMKPSESVLEFRARLSELESQLGGIGYNTSEAEQLRALLRGLRDEFGVTAEVIR